MPQKFREKLGEEFMLTTGPDYHVRIYPMSVWETLEEQLIGDDVYDEQDPSLNFLQRLFGNCESASIDQQNRLSIPRHMRNWADLIEGETAVFIGQGTRIEIWSRSKWEAFSKTFTAANAARASFERKATRGLSGARPGVKEPELTLVGPEGDNLP